MFYGWYIVAAITFIGVIIGGTTTLGTTALVNPIAATMGWSYAHISLAMTIRGIESGVMNPLASQKAGVNWNHHNWNGLTLPESS